MEPLFPVPRRIFPAGEKAAEKTRSSCEVQRVSGEPSGEIFTTSAPPVAEGKKGSCGMESGSCVVMEMAPDWPMVMGVAGCGAGEGAEGEGAAGRDFSPMEEA